ncbi:MAG: hypothetical protein OER86_09570 [Phycisphaerae bacterium]|nr:hypothetical protein [Phycisphaerae bacterium]
MSPRSVLMVSAVLVLGALALQQSYSAPEPDPKGIMQKKLGYTQAVLRAIVHEDFDQIWGNAASLTALSGQADWQVVKHPQYLAFSTAFRDAVQQMADAAKRKNLEGATLGYMQMTLACVHCHRYVRSLREARLDDPASGALALSWEPDGAVAPLAAEVRR